MSGITRLVRPRARANRNTKLLYAILCYNDESAFASCTREDEDAIMQKLAVVKQKLTADGRLGPVARLLPTSAAVTVRKDREKPFVLDGPFAETKEQLLGFYVVNCASLDEAIQIAQDLAHATPGGAYEIRAVSSFAEGAVGGV